MQSVLLHYNAIAMGRFLLQHTAVLLAVLLSAGCSGNSALSVHSPPVEQGNIYAYKDIVRLKVGMSKEQVRYIIGVPMLEDPFNQDRWDYYYSFSNNRKQVVKRHHLILRFDDNTLVDIDEAVPVERDTKSLRAETELQQRADDALLLDQQ